VEIAAYYVIAEALTNVARYAQASEARVAVRQDGGRLVVEVSDDGKGGADAKAGSGLRGLADRLAAIGGEVNVTSSSGGGTTVTASMPASG
jgi:signal transduction histidine kinase